jgi:hypothetical protein
VVAAVIALISGASSAADTCVMHDPQAARNELRSAKPGPELINTTYFSPQALRWTSSYVKHLKENGLLRTSRN